MRLIALLIITFGWLTAISNPFIGPLIRARAIIDLNAPSGIAPSIAVPGVDLSVDYTNFGQSGSIYISQINDEDINQCNGPCGKAFIRAYTLPSGYCNDDLTECLPLEIDGYTAGIGRFNAIDMDVYYITSGTISIDAHYFYSDILSHSVEIDFTNATGLDYSGYLVIEYGVDL